MSLLPLRLSWELAQDRWASILNPFINAKDTVLFKVVGVPSGTISSSFSLTNYPNIDYDTANGYSGGKYTVSNAAYLSISASFTITGSSFSIGDYCAIQIQQNGIPLSTSVGRNAVGTGNGTFTNFVYIESKFAALDIISINSASSYGTPIYSSVLDATESFFTISFLGAV